jgi:type IV fimbrial biogenesis protein FimT
MVALAVFAILATIGIPSLTNVIANNRATAAANELLSTLQFARSEAVKRNENIIAEPTDGDDWTEGWVVRRGVGDVLRSRQAQHPSVTIAKTAAPTSLTFRPAGNVDGASNFTITVNGTAGATRCLTLQPSGRGVVSQGGC